MHARGLDGGELDSIILLAHGEPHPRSSPKPSPEKAQALTARSSALEAVEPHSSVDAATYQDHGPAQRFTFKSTQVLAVTCSPDRREANIYGVGTVDGSGNHFFLIQVRDAGKSGRNDTYRILIATGYDSGTHRLEGGNVTIK
jgi:hypothetical protein